MPRSSALFHSLCLLASAAFLVAFFVLPGTLARGWLASAGLPANIAPVMMVATTLAALLFHLLSGIFASGAAPVSSPLVKARRPLVALQILLSLAIFGHTVRYLDTPLDEDEKNIGAVLGAESFGAYLGTSVTGEYPDSGRDQLLPNFLSWGSMRVLGASELTLRLPALFFTLLFLFGIFFASAHLSTRATVFLYLHALSSQQILWYLHSSRGYASYLAFSTWAVALVLAGLEGNRSRPVVTALVFLGLLFSHTFGGLFLFLLLLALALAVHRREASASARGILLVGVAVLPLALPFYLGHSAALIRQGFLFDAIGNFTDELPFATMLGIEGNGYGKAIALLVVGLGVAYWRRGLRAPRVDFLWAFLGISFAFFCLLAVAGGVHYWPGRLFLGFVPVLILAVIESARGLSRRASVVAAVAFIGLPLWFRGTVLEKRMTEFGPDKAFHELMRDTRLQTGNLPAGCYEFRGSPREVRWARNLYFAGTTSLDCPRRFIISLDEHSGRVKEVALPVTRN